MGAANDLALLTAKLGLGELVIEPRPVTGGLLHRMWRVETASGIYAVKALNPEVMARPGALSNMRLGERVAAVFAKSIPAMTAVEIGGERVHALTGCWYIVYPWAEGAPVYPPEITADHCAAIGDILGRIHARALRLPGIELDMAPPPALGWPGLLQALPTGAAWRERLEAALDDLVRWSDAAREAASAAEEPPVLSHRDLDPKNVLWQGRSPRLIDWEAAGWVLPRRELLQVLLDWADDGRGGLDGRLIDALLSAYYQHGVPDGDWETAFRAGRLNMLEWLHYNARRAAGLTSPEPGEQRRGASEVLLALDALNAYEGKIDTLRARLARS